MTDQGGCNMKKLTVFTLTVFLTLMFVAGCISNGPKTEVEGSKIINWVMGADAITLDHTKAEDNLSGEIIYHVCDPLRRSIGGIFEPAVAKDYDISEDGLTFTYYLRDSLWSDGEPVVAQQFVDAIIRILDPRTATANAHNYYPIVNAKAYNTGEITDASLVGVSAPDEHTLVENLEEICPPFFDVCSSTYPIRKDVLEEYGESYGSEADKFIGNGPFKVKSWTHDISVEMVKNENYWNAEAVRIDQLNRLVVQDGNTRVSMYDKGEVNFVGAIPVVFEEKYEKIHPLSSGAVVALEFNLRGMNPETGKVLSNVNFRKALSYAVDREPLAKAVGGKAWKAAHRVLSDAHMGVADTYHNEYPLQNTLPKNADPAKAQEYLAQALTELDMTIDQLPEFTFLLFDVESYKMFSEAIVDGWEKVLGLKCFEISLLPIPQCIQAGYDGKFDIYFQGIGGNRDPYYNLEYWTTNGAINWTGWSDPTYDQMVADTNRYIDREERFAKIVECEQYLFDHGPIEPLFYSGNCFVYDDEVITGVTTEAFGCAYQFVYADMKP